MATAYRLEIDTMNEEALTSLAHHLTLHTKSDLRDSPHMEVHAGSTAPSEITTQCQGPLPLPAGQDE
jgi:hypothetical protein